MNDREKLTEEINNLYPQLDYIKPSHMDLIVDFIIADRKRIVEPLVKKYPITNDAEQVDICIKAITETLINAGIDIYDIGS